MSHWECPDCGAAYERRTVDVSGAAPVRLPCGAILCHGCAMYMADAAQRVFDCDECDKLHPWVVSPEECLEPAYDILVAQWGPPPPPPVYAPTAATRLLGSLSPWDGRSSPSSDAAPSRRGSGAGEAGQPWPPQPTWPAAVDGAGGIGGGVGGGSGAHTSRSSSSLLRGEARSGVPSRSSSIGGLSSAAPAPAPSAGSVVGGGGDDDDGGAGVHPWPPPPPATVWANLGAPSSSDAHQPGGELGGQGPPSDVPGGSQRGSPARGSPARTHGGDPLPSASGDGAVVADPWADAPPAAPSSDSEGSGSQRGGRRGDSRQRRRRARQRASPAFDPFEGVPPPVPPAAHHDEDDAAPLPVSGAAPVDGPRLPSPVASPTGRGRTLLRRPSAGSEGPPAGLTGDLWVGVPRPIAPALDAAPQPPPVPTPAFAAPAAYPAPFVPPPFVPPQPSPPGRPFSADSAGGPRRRSLSSTAGGDALPPPPPSQLGAITRGSSRGSTPTPAVGGRSLQLSDLGLGGSAPAPPAPLHLVHQQHPPQEYYPHKPRDRSGSHPPHSHTPPLSGGALLAAVRSGDTSATASPYYAGRGGAGYYPAPSAGPAPVVLQPATPFAPPGGPPAGVALEHAGGGGAPAGGMLRGLTVVLWDVENAHFGKRSNVPALGGRDAPDDGRGVHAADVMGAIRRRLRDYGLFNDADRADFYLFANARATNPFALSQDRVDQLTREGAYVVDVGSKPGIADSVIKQKAGQLVEDFIDFGARIRNVVLVSSDSDFAADMRRLLTARNARGECMQVVLVHDRHTYRASRMPAYDGSNFRTIGWDEIMALAVKLGREAAKRLRQEDAAREAATASWPSL